MRRLLILGLIVGTLFLSIGIRMIVTAQNDPTVSPIAIPTTVYRSQAEIEGWIQSGDVDSMYAHVWDLWAALTAPSGQFVPGESGNIELPVWETWFSAYDVFQLGPVVHGTQITQDGVVSAVHDFEPLKQLTEFSDPDDEVADTQVSSVRYNADSAQFIWDNNYYLSNMLNKQLAACDVTAPPQDCSITSFPSTAINMKPVFYPISGNAISIIPVWKGVVPYDSPDPTVNVNFQDLPTKGAGPETWLNCIAIDLTETPHQANDIIPIADNGGKVGCTEATVVNLTDFYTVYATDAVIAQYNQVLADGEFDGHQQSLVYDPAVQSLTRQDIAAGDTFVFVASHVTTREIQEWVWFTVWWSPEPDDETTIPFPPTEVNTQDYISTNQMYVNYPGTGKGRPDTITTPWNHYVLCINYMFVYPPQPLTGGSNDGTKPQFCFNPYLEANFNTNTVPDSAYGTGGGINTNCMACHGNANWGQGSPAIPAYIRAEYTDRNDPQFTDLLQLDFAWSLQRAQRK